MQSVISKQEEEMDQDALANSVVYSLQVGKNRRTKDLKFKIIVFKTNTVGK